jgi:5-methylcytosine-specific restriction endonuclease McrA
VSLSNDFDWDDDYPLTTVERGYGEGWPRLRAWCIRLHVSKHGWVCPGFMVPAHPSHDLTGHHVLALSEGGESVPGNVAILCIGCNSREATYRRHPRKRCPLGLVCRRLPTGSPLCCA